MISKEDLERILPEYDKAIPNEFTGIPLHKYLKQSFERGSLFAIMVLSDVKDYLEKKLLQEEIDDIILGLSDKIEYSMPENPWNHLEETIKICEKTTKDYIDRWQMYNELFNKAA